MSEKLYQYRSLAELWEIAVLISEGVMPADFERFGIDIYVGSMPEITGPELHIDPDDKAGVEIFIQFCRQMAEHYKTINPPA